MAVGIKISIVLNHLPFRKSASYFSKLKLLFTVQKINLLNIYYGGLSSPPGVQEDRDIENHKLCLPVDQKQYLG